MNKIEKERKTKRKKSTKKKKENCKHMKTVTTHELMMDMKNETKQIKMAKTRRRQSC